MRERPILFSGPMVRAILAGQKTQSRRTVSLTPKPTQAKPYGVPGDRLWVREAWRAVERESDRVDGVLYAADGVFEPIEDTMAAAERWVDVYDNGKHGTGWRPSIFLPRWACRLVLEVVDVAVERLHDLTPEGAIAEGAVHAYSHQTSPPPVGAGMSMEAHRAWGKGALEYRRPTLVGYFARLWDDINGERLPWCTNPMVWVITFRRLP